MSRTLELPPGPLAWLYPEFLEIEARRYRRADRRAWRELAPRDAAVLELGADPLSRSAATVLRQRGFEVRCKLNSRGLEAALAHLDGAALGTEVLLGELDRSARLWVLPLPPGPALLDALREALARLERAGDPLVERRPIPYFRTPDCSFDELRAQPDERAVRTRLAPSWWGLLPGSLYEETERTLFHELLRTLHPERYFLFRALENAALCGEDLYARAFARSIAADPAPRDAGAATRRALVIGMEGIDGAGKSSHVAALAEHLRARGFAVAVHKIYRHGLFHETVTDLARQCAGGRHLQLWSLERQIKVFDSLKVLHARVLTDLQHCDVVLFDRYLPTHYAAGVGRTHVDPAAREMLSAYPRADRIFWLDVPVEEALARLSQRGETTIDENPYMLSRYRASFRNLAARERFEVLDGLAPFDVNQAHLRRAAEVLLEARGLRP